MRIGSQESAILNGKMGRHDSVVERISGTRKLREGEDASGQPAFDNTPNPMSTCSPYSDLIKKEEGEQVTVMRKETAERLN